MSKPTEHDLCVAELRSMTVVAEHRLDKINELKSENQALRDQLSIAVCGLKDIEDHWEVNESQDIAKFALSRLDKFLNK